MNELQEVLKSEFIEGSSLKTNQLVELLEQYIDSNNVEISNVKNFVNRTLSDWAKNEVIYRIGKGEYILATKADVLTEEERNNLYDNEKQIKLLNKIVSKDDWFYSSLSLEKYIGLSIQRGAKLRIVLSKKPTESLLEKLSHLDIIYTYPSYKVDSLISYSIAHLLHSKKFSDDDIDSIRRYMKINDIKVSDLVKYSFTDINFNKHIISNWQINSRAQGRQIVFAYNIKLMLGE